MKLHCEAYLTFNTCRCSVVGLDRINNYFNYVPVDKKSLSSKALLHMLFQILGRYHEHERADRDKYIDILEENIIEGRCIYAITMNITLL